MNIVNFNVHDGVMCFALKLKLANDVNILVF